MNTRDDDFFNKDESEFLLPTDADIAQTGGENIDLNVEELLNFMQPEEQIQFDETQTNFAPEFGTQEPAVESSQTTLPDHFILKKSVVDEFLNALDKKDMEKVLKIAASSFPLLEWLRGEQPTFSEVPPLSINDLHILIKLLQSPSIDPSSTVNYTRFIEDILNRNPIFIEAIGSAPSAQQKELLHLALLFPWSLSSKFTSKLLTVIKDDLLERADKDVDVIAQSVDRIAKNLRVARFEISKIKQIKESELALKRKKEMEEERRAEKLRERTNDASDSKKQKTTYEDEKKNLHSELLGFLKEKKGLTADNFDAAIKSLNSPINRQKK